MSNKINTLVLTTIFSSLLASSAFACAEPPERVLDFKAIENMPRIDHYEASAPKNIKEALKLLDEKTTAVKKAFKDNKLEAVHEHSYTLEASAEAIDSYIDDLEEMLEKLEDSIEVIHNASEDGESSVIKAELPKFTKYSAEVIKLIK